MANVYLGHDRFSPSRLEECCMAGWGISWGGRALGGGLSRLGGEPPRSFGSVRSIHLMATACGPWPSAVLSLLRNLAAAGLGEIAGAAQRRLKKTQYCFASSTAGRTSRFGGT
ncbi:hypothetical protein [Streptomyces cylindrosporus]|uniref:Uncharacterized protein n=1 Tax=Streptomyces cylindrosporus TaxID=2927583 RepID=A0ABS9YLY1_9ACTN|nr:hypothetical protein [Streptomyces cylindrosporus]MCI3276856.1 hypothetical protein [Streptomyces cylindrosporus]